MEDGARKGKHGGGDLSPAAAELRAAVDSLALRHQVELQKCLAVWLCRQEEAQCSGQPLCRQDEPQCHGQAESFRSTWGAEPGAEAPPPLPPPEQCIQLPLPGSMHADDEPLRQSEIVQRGPSTGVGGSRQPKEMPPNGFCVKATPSERKEIPSNMLRRTTSVKTRFKKAKSAMHAGNFLMKSKRDEAFSKQTRLQRLISNRYYEWCSGVLIVCNAIFMGCQTQVYAERAADNALHGRPQDSRDPPGFAVGQVLFCLAFAVDLVLRWSAEGLKGFFLNSDFSWNVFDTVVVGFNILDMVISLAWRDAGQQGVVLASASLLRISRVVRIVRVARVIRIMRFFKELRMMVYSILGSLKSLVWVMMILVLLFFIFGISMTTGTIEKLSSTEMWQEERNQNLLTYFGRLDSSILHLYMAMSGGRDWSEYYEALEPLGWMYRSLFLLYISFAILAVFNIVTGVFVESALQSNHNDREIIVQEELAEKESYLSSMEQVFEEMDDDGTGNISMEEFEEKLNDERVIAYFNSLKLDASDGRKLFTLLDFDQSGEIDITEFLAGCHKLKGESRALDMAIMQLEVKWLGEAITHLHRIVENTFTPLALAHGAAPCSP